MQISSCDTTTCFLCNNSSAAWRTAIGIHKKTMQYKRGEAIFLEGETVSGIYFIFKGRVKMHKHWGSGKELIVRFAKAGDVVGYRGLWGKELYPISATALENTTACFIDKEFLEASLQTNAGLTYKLMQLYATELQKAETRMTNLAHMDVKGRIAEALLALKAFFGCNEDGFIDIVISRQDIASFAGTTYETIFKVFAEWVATNTIKTDGKTLAILNEQALLDLL